MEPGKGDSDRDNIKNICITPSFFCGHQYEFGSGNTRKFWSDGPAQLKAYMSYRKEVQGPLPLRYYGYSCFLDLVLAGYIEQHGGQAFHQGGGSQWAYF